MRTRTRKPTKADQILNEQIARLEAARRAAEAANAELLAFAEKLIGGSRKTGE